MTYCVGMMLDKGLVMMSDTRTNSGVDNISTFRKMQHWSVPGERLITILTAGNLATTQGVISQLVERNKAPSERHNSLLEAPTMYQVATIIGKLLRDTIAASDACNGETAGTGTFTASTKRLAVSPCALRRAVPAGNRSTTRYQRWIVKRPSVGSSASALPASAWLIRRFIDPNDADYLEQT